MWGKIKKLWRDATRLDLTANKGKGIEAVAKTNQTVFTDPNGNTITITGKPGQDHGEAMEAFIKTLQSHVKDLESKIQVLKNESALNTATENNLIKLLDMKDNEIADLKKQIKNMRIIGGEMNDYDSPMKGMQL